MQESSICIYFYSWTHSSLGLVLVGGGRFKKEMGLKECEIIFDNPYNTYYVGQTVNGRVEITLDSPKKIRGTYESVPWLFYTAKLTHF